MKKRGILVLLLTLSLLVGLFPADFAAEGETDWMEGLSIAWVDTENQLDILGSDNLVTEFKILGYGYRNFPYGDYGLRSAEGELLLPLQYGTTLPGGPMGSFVVDVRKTEADYPKDTEYTDFLGRVCTLGYVWDPPVPEAYREPSPDGHDKWGYADPWTGEKVLPAIYDAAGNFSEGIAVVEMDGEQFAIDLQGERLFDLNDYIFVGPFKEGRAWVRRLDPDGEGFGEGFIDTAGKEVIPAIWDLADGAQFQDGLVPAWDGEKMGYLDRDGQLVIPCVLDGGSEFSDGLAVIRYNGRQGILKHPFLAEKVSDWAKEELSAAAAAGYVTPSCETYQTFSITRKQFAELAVNYLEKKLGRTIEPAAADTFTDTDDEAILKAYAAGIVQGRGDGSFGPGIPLTREQLATMLWRAMEQVGAGMIYGSLDQYEDADQISDWAAIAMNNLIHHQVMAGTGERTLSPKATCTVEQAILLVSRAAARDYTLPEEREAQHQAAIDQASIAGISIGVPFDQLPQELLAALKQEGEPYDAGVFVPGEEIGRRYTAPGIEIITSEATEKVLQRFLSGQSPDYLLEYYGSADWKTVYDQMLGREYVDTVILTGDSYSTVSGLKVGDSVERARELGYDVMGESYSRTVGFDGTVTLSIESGRVARIQVYDCIGRRIGAFADP